MDFKVAHGINRIIIQILTELLLLRNQIYTANRRTGLFLAQRLPVFSYYTGFLTAVCEPLPPKINCNNKLPQGLSLTLCLYNASTIRQMYSEFLHDNTPNMSETVMFVINPQIKKVFVNQKVQSTDRKSQSLCKSSSQQGEK